MSTEDGDGGGGIIKTITKTVVPDWIKGSTPLKRLSSISAEGASSLVRFATIGPKRFIRRTIYTPILRMVLGVVATLFGAFLTLIRGSQPGYSPNEKVWGLTDLLPATVDFLLGMLLALYSSYVDVAIWIVRNIIPQMPGPIDGLVVTIVFAIEVVVTWELSVRLFRAILDSIPVASGFETFLFK